MKKLTPATSGAHGETESEGASRREFLQAGTGAAAGAAVIFGMPKAASVALGKSGSGGAAEAKPALTKPSGRAPREPVTAYVRNARRGEVTVMSGKQEITYRDPALVKRLLEAAGGPRGEKRR
jgi:hypothetical protein